jgi:hypothetical protein
MSDIKYTSEWLELSRSGKFKEAQEMYFSKLLPEISEVFAEKHDDILENEELLISILGFSPEPIIMTALSMRPSKHIIVTTGENKKVEEILTSSLEDFNLVRLPDESFLSMYKALKEQLVLNNYSRVVIDITGGKKSMVASAAIFGKDYGCKIVYVDFSEYLEDLRKPKPGTEILNLVYDPSRDQPELKNQ